MCFGTTQFTKNGGEHTYEKTGESGEKDFIAIAKGDVLDEFNFAVKPSSLPVEMGNRA